MIATFPFFSAPLLSRQIFSTINFIGQKRCHSFFPINNGFLQQRVSNFCFHQINFYTGDFNSLATKSEFFPLEEETSRHSR